MAEGDAVNLAALTAFRTFSLLESRERIFMTVLVV